MASRPKKAKCEPKPKVAKSTAETDSAHKTLGAEQVAEVRQRAAKTKQLQACLGQIVMLLLRSSADRQRPLHDLEHSVIPALNAGQFVIAEAQNKETGAVQPIGAVLWAFVSSDVDGRLASPDQSAPLKPEEWRSGDIPWIMGAIGEPKVVDGMLQQLTKSIFKDRPPKMRHRSPAAENGAKPPVALVAFAGFAHTLCC
jgi:cytolysin-activating lysine-acyltransferase